MEDDIDMYSQIRINDRISYQGKINDELNSRYNEISSMMLHIQRNFDSKVISKDKYNNLMERLDGMLDDYSKIREDVYDDDMYGVMTRVMRLKGSVVCISKECGMLRCSLLMRLHFMREVCDMGVSSSYMRLVDFYDNFFIPVSCMIERDDSNVELKVELLPFAKKGSVLNKTFMEKIDGADIYFPYDGKFLVVSGYFRKDSLNISRVGGTLGDKLRNVRSRLKLLMVDDSFKDRYLEQLSLRDFIVCDENEICDSIESAHKDLVRYRTKVLSQLVKEFITGSIEKQRYILTLLLLSNSEYQLFAHIIYGMICDASELLKPQPMADEIYKSLHYSVQKLFKIASKDVDSKIAKLQTLTEDDIPYDKRIAMMNVGDNVKGKALDKLKEVKSSREGSGKAQQYLDGLLKIPFGVYKKEPIMTFLGDYCGKLLKLIEEVRGVEDSELRVDSVLLDYLRGYNMDLDTEGMVDSFIGGVLSLGVMDSVIDEDVYGMRVKRLISDWDGYKVGKRDYLDGINRTLDECVYGHSESKNQLKRLLGQWMNGKMDGTVFGFQGPPGTGKTTMAKKGLAKCLLDEDGNPRPFGFLALGGSSNGSTLEGHSYTYLGSQWGRIVDILMESKCMNPVIYIDEVDKISNTEHGREIVGILTHMTDPSQNYEFSDRYFGGIKLDLSKVLFVMSYNDSSKIDRILRDRITEINVKALTLSEKVYIVKNYAMPEILEKVGYKREDIIINNAEVRYIIQNYTNEAGVRKLREKLFELVREINLKRIFDSGVELPYIITEEYIKELFSEKPRVHLKKIASEPQVGFVNGLYATVSGTGGLTIVECVKTPSDRKLSLELTGQQGDVMKESMMCAKTLAWNIIPKSVKKDIADEFDVYGNFGLHIHCPEASTPKDGPSAGITITTAIISRLCGIKVRNDIAMTGEIDLHGNVHAIGGLDAKLEGAKRAGVKLVLIPKDNEDDYNKILKRMDDEVVSSPREKLPDVVIVSTIMEVIENALVENDMEFINVCR